MTTGHNIYTRHHRVETSDRLPIPLIKKCIRDTLRLEGVNARCEVSVLITDDDGIKRINDDYRGIDKPTDVISFPMLIFSSPGWFDPGPGAVEQETGSIPLGEIVISAERARYQADEYGHSIAWETAYLIVHSVLHLLGYDHVDEAGDKRLMRNREKEIMKELGL